MPVADLDGDIDLLVLRNGDVHLWLNMTVTTGTAVNPLDPSISMELAPNPVRALLSIMTEFPAKTFDLSIYDSSGRRVTHLPRAAVGALSIDLSGQPAGLYVLRAVFEDISDARSFILLNE